MITFDKLKLISGIGTFQIMNGSVFNRIVKNDEVIGLEYRVNSPFLLRN